MATSKKVLRKWRRPICHWPYHPLRADWSILIWLPAYVQYVCALKRNLYLTCPSWQSNGPVLTLQWPNHDTPIAQSWHSNDSIMTLQYPNHDTPMTQSQYSNDLITTLQWPNHNTPMTQSGHSSHSIMTHRWPNHNTTVTHNRSNGIRWGNGLFTVAMRSKWINCSLVLQNLGMWQYNHDGSASDSCDHNNCTVCNWWECEGIPSSTPCLPTTDPYCLWK